MKKAFGQTVRDIKREVNKKVLKVPSVEQKVLDATSNEPWGPHGTVLADIAQASRNYHDYQMIMAIIWKRINDTGKNWRHVYKALTVLEYLVANGSERVIDDIREHAYQIQTLSDFQYIDSSGKDQGNNVRKKSQSLVVLANDKERIVEVRQKAAANREKYRNTNSGSMYRAGSYSGSGGFEDEHYDGRYGSRDEDRNGNGKEREYGYKDDDRYGRSGDSYGRDGSRGDREYEDHYNRDGYKDDDSRGRSHSVDGYQYGSRSRSSDRDQEDSQYSSRGSFATADASSQDGSNFEKRLERKLSEQNIGAPPSYEEVVGAARSPTYSEQGGENPSASAPASYSSPANASPSKAAPSSASQPAFPSPPASSSPHPISNEKGPDSFDEFDPRGSFSAATIPSNISAQNSAAEMDLLGSLSESFSSNSLALVPSGSATSAPGTEAFGDSGSGISSSSLAKEAFDDPFDDGLFKAIPSTDHLPAQNLNTISTSSYPAASNESLCPPQMVLQRQGTGNNQGDMFPGVTYAQSSASTPNHDIDILADILPPTAPQALTSSETSFPPHAKDPSSQAGLPLQNNLSVSQTGNPSQTGVHEGSGQPVLMSSYYVQPGHPFLPAGLHSGQHVPQANLYPQTTQNPSPASFMDPTGEVSQTGFQSQSGQPTSVTSFPVPMGSSPHTSFQAQPTQQNVNLSGSYSPQTDSRGSVAPQMSSQVFAGPPGQGILSHSNSVSSTSSQTTPSPQVHSSTTTVSQPMVPASTGLLTNAPQPADDKFKTKSTVWADTLSRGLVNLNISGSKINPLADIGVDFDAINRKDKRMEKPTTAPTVSNITMGKAMGTGSGLGRAGAGVLRPPSTPMMGSGIGMGMGMGSGMSSGPRPAIGMGGHGAVNQPLGVGMGMNMPPNMGMGGIGQGGQMQQPMGFPPGSTMPGGYYPMSGTGSYGQHYGGGYR